MSILKKYTGKASVSDVTTKAPDSATPSSLKSINKRAKNANNNWPDLALQVSSTSFPGRKLMKPESTKKWNPGGAHDY